MTPEEESPFPYSDDPSRDSYKGKKKIKITSYLNPKDDMGVEEYLNMLNKAIALAEESGLTELTMSWCGEDYNIEHSIVGVREETDEEQAKRLEHTKRYWKNKYKGYVRDTAFFESPRGQQTIAAVVAEEL